MVFSMLLSGQVDYSNTPYVATLLTNLRQQAYTIQQYACTYGQFIVVGFHCAIL
jgi:hypothetical protein